MFYLLLSFLLIGCSMQIPVAESDIRKAAIRNINDKRYNIAGEHYFALWCNYPATNVNALFDAAKAYCSAGEYNKAIELLNDYNIMNGDINKDVYFLKGLIYYNQVKSPLKNVNKAEMALVNFKEYKKFKLSNIEGILEKEEYLNDIVNYSNMLDAYYSLNSTPPGLVYAMEKAYEELKLRPNGKYIKYLKEIYNLAKANLGLK